MQHTTEAAPAAFVLDIGEHETFRYRIGAAEANLQRAIASAERLAICPSDVHRLQLAHALLARLYLEAGGQAVIAGVH